MYKVIKMNDYMISATAAGAQIRAFAAVSTGMVEKARQTHNTSPVITAALGRLITAGAMMGRMMKGEKDLLTLRISGDGPVKGIIVTADSQGHVKGYANVPDVIISAKPNGKLDVSGAIGDGFLDVIKDLGLKEPYSGTVPLQSGEIAEDLTYYFAVSEQVPSSVGLGVLMNHDNTVRCAGGFIIQLMPFATDECIDKLEENLKALKPVTEMMDEGLDAEGILGEVLKGFDIEINEKNDIEYRCDCSRDRIVRALISLGRTELQSLADEGEDIRINCAFCNTNYVFKTDEIKEILKNG